MFISAALDQCKPPNLTTANISGYTAYMYMYKESINALHFTHAGRSLLWVAFLIIIFLFIYAVVSFVFLHESVNNPQESLYCDRLIECFITITRVGLVDSFGSVSSSIHSR